MSGLIEQLENKIFVLAEKILPKFVVQFVVKMGGSFIVPAFIVFVALSTIITVWLSQLFADMQPCILCYYERVPFYVSGIIALFALINKFSINARRNLIRLCLMLFLINIGLAIYHIGVEHFWWAGTDECRGNDVVGFTIEDLQRSLIEAQPARCEDIQWSLFGKNIFTFALLNMMASSFMALFCWRGTARDSFWQK